VAAERRFLFDLEAQGLRPHRAGSSGADNPCPIACFRYRPCKVRTRQGNFELSAVRAWRHPPRLHRAPFSLRASAQRREAARYRSQCAAPLHCAMCGVWQAL